MEVKMLLQTLEREGFTLEHDSDVVHVVSPSGIEMCSLEPEPSDSMPLTLAGEDR